MRYKSKVSQCYGKNNNNTLACSSLFNYTIYPMMQNDFNLSIHIGYDITQY